MVPVFIGMLAYALIHSILASKDIKTSFRTRFGERAYYGLYRLGYNLFAGASILPIFLLVIFRPGKTVWEVDLTLEPLLLIIQAAGLIGLSVSLLQIDLMRFLGVSQLAAYLRDEPLPLPEEPLQTRGLYGLIRHPLYLFSIMVIWPVTTMTAAYLGFCISTTFYFVVGSLYEERRMVESMGETYINYRKNVPWMLPRPRFGNKP